MIASEVGEGVDEVGAEEGVDSGLWIKGLARLRRKVFREVTHATTAAWNHISV